MNRALFLSLALHGCLLLSLLLTAAFRPQQAKGLYPRTYKVRLVAAPQPAAEDLPGEPGPVARPHRLAAVEPGKANPKPAPKKAAKPEAKSAPKSGPATPSAMPSAMPPGMKILATEGGSADGSYYLGVIMAKISRNWNNPYQGRQGELRTRVYFRINRSGEIEAAGIEQPSGNAVFDQAGLRAVHLAKNFPPLPPEITAQTLGVHFEFEYLK